MDLLKVAQEVRKLGEMVIGEAYKDDRWPNIFYVTNSGAMHVISREGYDALLEQNQGTKGKLVFIPDE